MASDSAGLSDDQLRKKRVGRIKPFVKDLRAEKEPKTNKAVLLSLIQDLKDEGNQLYKESKFSEASNHYKWALDVSQVLEERFYHDIEDGFMATLYTNGSLSYLKADNARNALDYAENALIIQPDNVKAKYRKVQALFTLKRYKETLAEAKDGMMKHSNVSTLYFCLSIYK